MAPYQAYRKQRETVPTRIDLILTLYDRALELLKTAEAALARGEIAATSGALGQVQLIVSGLAAGSTEQPEGLAHNFLRLYEFVASRLTEPTTENIQAARRVLEPLREAFESIRGEALRLEREGQLPPLEQSHSIQATA